MTEQMFFLRKVGDEIHGRIPMPPSQNEAYSIASSRIFLSRKTREFRAILARLKIMGQIDSFSCQTEMQAWIYPARKSSDSDNRTKQLQDAIESCGIVENDNQIVRSMSERCQREKKQIPHVYFILRPFLGPTRPPLLEK